MSAGFTDAQRTLDSGTGNNTAECNGKPFKIIPGDLAMMLAWLPDGGGAMDTPTFAFQCSQADAPEDLASGAVVVVNEERYVVKIVHPGVANPLINVYCIGVNQ